MGVRHRKYMLEAVQYHPESILSESELFADFLKLRGATWENLGYNTVDTTLPPFEIYQTATVKANVCVYLGRVSESERIRWSRR